MKTKKEWTAAQKHLEACERAYAQIGSPGYFCLTMVIRPLRDRFVRGERTDELYDAIMEVSL